MGPGKYDDLCTEARKKAKAAGVLLIVLGGEKGSGFSMQAQAGSGAGEMLIRMLPQLLRDVADQIEGDAQ